MATSNSNQDLEKIIKLLPKFMSIASDLKNCNYPFLSILNAINEIYGLNVLLFI